MKVEDISQTPLVRKYGLRGAKVFGRVWFAFIYVLLIGLNTGFWMLGPELRVGRSRIAVACFASVLIVVAASLLTRMRLGYSAAVDQLAQSETR